MDLEDYVPVDNFGKDHWTTLAYAETVMVDCGGFQVGCDARMRQGRRHYRVMREMCMNPKRISGRSSAATVMDLKYSTVLKDGTMVQGHDDWHCVQDMANAGWLHVDGYASADAVEPGAILHLTALGRTVADQLRAHKAAGGTFASFTPQVLQAA